MFEGFFGHLFTLESVMQNQQLQLNWATNLKANTSVHF